MIALSHMEKILDDANTKFFCYDPKRAAINSKITADYVLKGEINNSPVILSFLVYDLTCKVYFAKSIFPLENYDYSKRQTQYTVLSKKKCILRTNQTIQLYLHPRYIT